MGTIMNGLVVLYKIKDGIVPGFCVRGFYSIYNVYYTTQTRQYEC